MTTPTMSSHRSSNPPLLLKFSSFGRPYVRADLNDLDIFYVINEALFLCFVEEALALHVPVLLAEVLPRCQALVD